MNNDFLKSRLQRVARRFQWIGLWRKLAACWALAALVSLALIGFQRVTGWTSPFLLPAVVALAGTVALAVALRHFERRPDYRWIARKVEANHPELNGLLLTAVQQTIETGQEPGYLQNRVIQEATARSQEQDWTKVVPKRRMVAIQGLHLVALVCFAFALINLRVEPIIGEAARWTGVDGMTVSPGDTSIEKGESLVVLARFGQRLPASVNLVVRENGAAPRSIALVKNMNDPIFGGSVPEVATDFVYHLEYRGQKTRDFKVSVFEHPRLARSDVELTFPDYTKLAPKRIEDTRRVSAVEGTKLGLALQLNKPVKSARLVSRDAQKTVIPLVVSADKAVATLPDFLPEKSAAYDLQLVDAEGRANKISSSFSFDVQPNRPPEIKLTSPRGDLRPSALEEVTFDGTVWDDFGSPAYGLAYSVAGAEPKVIELGRDVTAKEKRNLAHLLRLEEMEAKPDDLISWYVWADDVGPDGKVRRTNGDLYFAEVRPYDEIFRESQMPGDDQQQNGGGGGGAGSETRKLTDLQKQIINATWKIKRDGKSDHYEEDVKVVTESQAEVLSKANAQAADAQTPRQQSLWKSVTQEMEKALEKLKASATDPGPLAEALPPEQAAYQALLKMQARETNVTRGQRGGGGGGGGQMTQRQIDQLDLKQNQNRYETQRQARAPQNQERSEQLAVMNRLQQLARRQQDLNERLKELQTSLQEARNDQEREELKKRLKRLEEEQRQMLADADEVRQRMDRAENQSNMSDERKQLDQTRDDLQKAADAAADGSVAQALASGTRAQRQLQQLRDDMRKENSSQFAEEMRDMRNEARELAREQELVTEKLDALNNSATQRRTLSDTGDRKEALDKLEQQKDRISKLVDRATQVSEQAENTEPLLSRQLYDSLRKLSQDDANSVKQMRQELLGSGRLTRDLYDRLQKASESEKSGKALDLTRELLRDGFVTEAGQAGQRARSEIDELRKGVERAAESVLGDDAEQLKLAQSELNELTDQLAKEIDQAGAAGEKTDGPGQAGNQPGNQPGDRGDRQANNERANAAGGDQPGDQPSTAPGQGPGDRQAQNGRPGQAGGRGQPGQAKQPGQPGQAGQPGSEGQQQASAGQPGGGQGQGNSDANAGDPSAQPGQQGGGGEQRQAANGRAGRGGANGGNRGGLTLDNILGGGVGGGAWNEGRFAGGPITGEDFNRWTERLGDVEQLLDSPDLRNAVATARERARLLRKDFRTELKKPDWAVVRSEIMKPLVEVRARVAEELARRDPKDVLAPIDRDPVPNRFAEAVRKYYEELGKDK